MIPTMRSARSKGIIDHRHRARAREQKEKGRKQVPRRQMQMLKRRNSVGITLCKDLLHQVLTRLYKSGMYNYFPQVLTTCLRSISLEIVTALGSMHPASRPCCCSVAVEEETRASKFKLRNPMPMSTFSLLFPLCLFGLVRWIDSKLLSYTSCKILCTYYLSGPSRIRGLLHVLR